MALTWSEKLSFLTTKGMSWKEVQEMDKGLEAEKTAPQEPQEPNEPQEPQEPNEPQEPQEPKEPTENEKKLLEKISELETQLKNAQAENVHGNNGGSPEPSFDEQLNEMFKDIRI